MPKPIHLLEKDVEVLLKKHSNMSTEQVRRVAIAAGSSVIVATPVDTGRARGNWRSTKNDPASGVTPRFGEADSLSELKRVSSSFTEKDSSIFIANNLPYIRRLNNGWSAQQPIPGWIERKVEAAFKSVKGWFIK